MNIDPLFFLHHCNLDRVLWNWQQKDLPRRLHEVGGPFEPLDYSGVNVTLSFEMNLGKLGGNATLEQLLNTQGDVVCYDYYTPELAAPQDGGNTGGWTTGRYARRG
jgi:tyrosinase